MTAPPVSVPARRLTLVLGAAGLALVLSACSSSSTSVASPPSVPPREASSVAGSTPVERAHVGHDDLVVAPEPVPTWDEAATVAAGRSAEEAVAAFLAEADDAAWWIAVSPLLSLTARQAYVGTDPTEIPGRAVVGAPVVLDAGSAYLARVRVPTDAGDYEVLLSRTGAAAPWLVERFGLPAVAEPAPEAVS